MPQQTIRFYTQLQEAEMRARECNSSPRGGAESEEEKMYAAERQAVREAEAAAEEAGRRAQMYPPSMKEEKAVRREAQRGEAVAGSLQNMSMI